jgi:hypothetical protein
MDSKLFSIHALSNARSSPATANARGNPGGGCPNAKSPH